MARANMGGIVSMSPAGKLFERRMQQVGSGIIGIFDSGVGGLTVATEVWRQLPAADTVYFGDTAHVPYGPRSAAELTHFADLITAFLIEQGAQVILDACNSTSAVALDFLQQKYPVPVIGVVQPGVVQAGRITKNGKVGVIATEATVINGAHRRLMGSLYTQVEVYAQPCPLFVPFVERGELDSPLVRTTASEYLKPLLDQGVDTLLLGCTHYPYLSPVLKEIMGEGVALIDPAAETVREVLAIGDWTRARADRNPVHKFFVSGDPDYFGKLGSRLTKNDFINQVDQVTLE